MVNPTMNTLCNDPYNYTIDSFLSKKECKLKVSKNNSRPIQKVNSRSIFYNSNVSDKLNKNYGNRMRCYTDTEFRESCAKLSENKDIKVYHSKNNSFNMRLTCKDLKNYLRYLVFLYSFPFLCNLFLFH